MNRLRTTRGSLREIVRRAVELHDRQAASGDGWNLPEMCDHLAMTILSMLPDVESNRDRWVPHRDGHRFQKRVGRFMAMRFAYIPPGIPAPATVLPQAGISWDDAIRRLEQAVDVFEEAGLHRDAHWPEHQYMGRLNAAQWRRFHHVHAAHHFSRLHRR